MAKSKKKEVSPFQAMKQVAEDKFGTRCYTGDEAKLLMVGVPLPSLSLMYLLDSNILPFSKMIGIAGFQQAQKSSFAYEMSRWIMNANQDTGGTCYFETEGEKLSPSLIGSVVGQKVFDDKRFNIYQCKTITQAQDMMTNQLLLYKKMNATQPLSMVIDSLTGGDAAETHDKVLKEGHAGRGYSMAALSWNSYLKIFCNELVGQPVCFLSVNHMKSEPSGQPFMPDIERTPGGRAQWFHSSIYLKLYRRKAEQRMTREAPGTHEQVPGACEVRNLTLKCAKTSIGKSDGRYISVDFIFYADRDTAGNRGQVSYFDWDASTAYLLKWLQGDAGKGVVKSAMRDVCDVSVVRNLYSSKKLGVSGLSPAAFGRAIHASPEMMRALMDFLGIQEHTIYAGKMPNPQKLPTPKEVAKAPKASTTPPKAPVVVK